jgi:hypothetical protein
MVMSMEPTVSMTMTALCRCGVGHGEASRDDQCRGERKFLHTKVLLLGERICPFNELTSMG